MSEAQFCSNSSVQVLRRSAATWKPCQPIAAKPAVALAGASYTYPRGQVALEDVDLDVADRGPPAVVGGHRDGGAAAGVVGTEHDHPRRDLGGGEHPSGDAAGVDVAGVGDDAREQRQVTVRRRDQLGELALERDRGFVLEQRRDGR